MTGLVEAVHSMICTKCLESGKLNKNGCRISKKGVPSQHLVIDFDKPCSPQGIDPNRCDYLLIANGDKGPGWVVPLEVKHGGLRASKVISQLQAGAHIAENIVPSEKQVKFHPVCAYGDIHTAELIKLRNESSSIKFHGYKEIAQLIRCGSDLTKVFRQ